MIQYYYFVWIFLVDFAQSQRGSKIEVFKISHHFYFNEGLKSKILFLVCLIVAVLISYTKVSKAERAEKTKIFHFKNNPWFHPQKLIELNLFVKGNFFQSSYKQKLDNILQDKFFMSDL